MVFCMLTVKVAKAGKKPAISCGVVIGGKEAIVVPMKLEEYKDGTKYPQI